MQPFSSPWSDAPTYLAATRPDQPVLFFHPSRLTETARRFQRGFPGLVTYAVKANPAPEVLRTLCLAGMRAFDVASPAEMAAVRQACPDAVLHYNNPVRSRAEVAQAIGYGVTSWSVDDPGELAKLAGITKGSEVSVRLRLPVSGAAYHFGEKFGADPDHAAALLQQMVQMGFRPSMTFHPGTQCADPAAWVSYIDACSQVAAKAGVSLHRLNVGGGFAAHRTGTAPNPERVFEAIGQAVTRAFGPNAPALVCEPGRAMVAEAYSLAARVKSVRSDGRVYLNDGIYGAMSEWRDIGMMDRLTVLRADGCLRTGPTRPGIVFGPTCDSIDRLPAPLDLPIALTEGDYLLFDGMGAYSLAIGTRFNGYGEFGKVSLR
jgi:ornithine decarboxylase